MNIWAGVLGAIAWTEKKAKGIVFALWSAIGAS